METLNFKIPPQITRGVTHNNIHTDLPGGKRQSRNKGPGVLWWKFNFNRKWEEGMDFFNFFNSRCGSFEPFIFIDPATGISYTVKFDSDEMSLEEFYQTAASYGIGIKQDLNGVV